MAQTLLSQVNDLLTKVDVLDSGGELTSLTDSARQTYVDLAVIVLNELVDELYGAMDRPKPSGMAEATLTLVTSDRDYALNANLVTLRPEFHLVDETNSHIIALLGDDGYRQIIEGDIGQDDTGLPSSAAIRPTDGELYMDRIPTANENGRVYKYRYDTDLELTSATDTFPFANAVSRALTPAAAELWKRARHNEMDTAIFRASISRAARLYMKLPPSDSWMPVKGPAGNSTDPMQA